MARLARPRPRVEGKQNPGVVGKGESPIGDSARTIPKPLASTRSEAAGSLLRRSKRPIVAG